ncbi:MAG: hypothetical protein NT001_02790, partial [Candidatus Woesearchaeota archaeon]|nr:hypothetical protein [Candidatus Woesearchaeota archaeon]
MAKHLFRIRLTNPSNDEEKEFAERSDSFRRSDEALSRYFPIHILDVPIYENEDSWRLSAYGRDLITEFGKVLFVKDRLFFNEKFRKMMKGIGYQRIIPRMFPSERLSEGGDFVFGDHFFFITNRLGQLDESSLECLCEIHPNKDPRRILRRINYINQKRIEFASFLMGGKEPYLMPPLHDDGLSHIDLNYQINDAARIIYCTESLLKTLKEYEGDFEQMQRRIWPLRKTAADKFRESYNRLEDIAKKWDYELREYKSADHGLNAIKDNCRLFTG